MRTGALVALTAAATVAVSIVAAEVGLRVIGAEGRVHGIHRIHERYLHAHIPNSWKWYYREPVNGGQAIRVRVNRAGYRGPEIGDGPGLRVAVFGDSFIAAEYSEEDATFVSQLGNRLAARLDTTVIAVNAGVVGYGPDQVLARLRDELPALSADLLVVGLFAHNDYGDLLRNKMFRLDADGNVVPNAFTIAEEASRRLAEQAPGGLLLPVFLRRWAGRLRPGSPRPAGRRETLAEALEQRAGEYRRYVEEGNNEVTHLFRDTFDADVALLPTSDAARYKVRLMAGILDQIGAVAREAGVPMLALIIPSSVDVTRDRGLQIDRDRYDAYRRSRLTDVLVSIAVERSISHVDLFEFWQRGADSLYFAGRNGHWNDRGQALAAGIVADFVVEEALLQP